MFLRDLVLSASIGVYPHEHAARQRVRINVDLGVEDDGARAMSRPRSGATSLSRVVDYEKVAVPRRAIVAPATSGWWRPWPSESPKLVCPTRGSTSPGYGWRSSTYSRMQHRPAWKSSDDRPICPRSDGELNEPAELAAVFDSVTSSMTKIKQNQIASD